MPEDPTDRWYAVALGGQHTVASTISGKVYTWGLNDEGQLGFDANYMAQRCTGPVAIGECCDGFCNRPQLLKGACNSPSDCLVGRKIVHVTAGLAFTILLDVEGSVWAFGSNSFGQLCQGRRVREFVGAGSRPVANFHVSTADWTSSHPARAHLPQDVRIADVTAGHYHVLAGAPKKSRADPKRALNYPKRGLMTDIGRARSDDGGAPLCVGPQRSGAVG